MTFGATPAYQDIDGFIVPAVFSAEAFKSALQYKARDEDVFIVTYPKCGTTWVQSIVSNIFRNGKPFDTIIDFMTQTPFLDMLGAETVEKMTRPGAIKSHLPFHMAPYNPKAKYIFVARNPKDCCVSFYYHTKKVASYQFTDGDFDTFFELFIDGKVEFGDYFDTLLSWYEHRNDPNVLFITYEQLKKETEKTILRIAEFLDSTYKEALLEDSDFLESVIKHSSFEFMEKLFRKYVVDLKSQPKQAILEADVSTIVKGILLSIPSLEPSEKPLFTRKGIIGDWRNHFSKEQNDRLEAKYRERTKDTDIPKLWEDCMTWNSLCLTSI